MHTLQRFIVVSKSIILRLCLIENFPHVMWHFPYRTSPEATKNLKDAYNFFARIEKRGFSGWDGWVVDGSSPRLSNLSSMACENH